MQHAAVRKQCAMVFSSPPSPLALTTHKQAYPATSEGQHCSTGASLDTGFVPGATEWRPQAAHSCYSCRKARAGVELLPEHAAVMPTSAVATRKSRRAANPAVLLREEWVHIPGREATSEEQVPVGRMAGMSRLLGRAWAGRCWAKLGCNCAPLVSS